MAFVAVGHGAFAASPEAAGCIDRFAVSDASVPMGRAFLALPDGVEMPCPAGMGMATPRAWREGIARAEDVRGLGRGGGQVMRLVTAGGQGAAQGRAGSVVGTAGASGSARAPAMPSGRVSVAGMGVGAYVLPTALP